jgi:hypothetical protein
MRKLSKTQLSFFAAGLFAFAPVAGAAPMGSSGAVASKRVAGSPANVEQFNFDIDTGTAATAGTGGIIGIMAGTGTAAGGGRASPLV